MLGMPTVREIVQRGEQTLQSFTERHESGIGLYAFEHRGLRDAIELGELPLERASPTCRIELVERLLVVDHGVSRVSPRAEDCAADRARPALNRPCTGFPTPENGATSPSRGSTSR